MKWIKQLLCNHQFYYRYTTDVTLTNGQTATQVVRRCKKCRKADVTIVPKGE